jgi:DNA-binding NarL/FixJ family response regulator
VIRVLVVDDQALVRAGFRMILEAEPDLSVVAESLKNKEAITQTMQLHPDVVLMDIRMPVLDGVRATERLACLPGAPRMVMLTTFDLDEYVYAALRAGASGFLLKDTPPEQLVDAVRIVARGDALPAPSVTRRLIEEVARQVAPVTPAPQFELLTDREREVLGLMAKGLSNAEIASHLVLGEATVKTHVGRILMKLGVRDRVQAVVLAYESGLVTPGTG